MANRPARARANEHEEKRKVELPREVWELAALFGERHPLYLIGGAVRDILLGRTPIDFDFATPATPDEVKQIVRGWADNLWTIGERFGTIALLKNDVKYEITTFRGESYPAGTRKPDVQFSRSLKADLSRRDFTVNAIAYSLSEKTFIDPFNGVEDLKKRVLRTPGPVEQSFRDDPLRMLRAITFHATLGLELTPQVFNGIVEHANLIAQVSTERISDELVKILMVPKPSEALRLMLRTGLSDYFLPELSRLDIEQPVEYHHKNVLEHTLQVVDNSAPILELRLACLLHDIAKPDTRDVVDGQIHFFKHELLGAQMAKRIMKRLKFPNHVTNAVVKLVKLHLRPHFYRDEVWTDSAVRRYIRDAGEVLPLLNQLVTADCTTLNPKIARAAVEKQRDLEERIAEVLEKEDLMAMRPILDGHQVMEAFNIAPGPLVGKILKALLQAQIDGELDTEEEAWELARRVYEQEKAASEGSEG